VSPKAISTVDVSAEGAVARGRRVHVEIVLRT